MTTKSYLKINFTALGFYHMQNAFDRDDYVKIQWENIEKKKKHNFKKYSSSEITDFNQNYGKL